MMYHRQNWTVLELKVRVMNISGEFAVRGLMILCSTDGFLFLDLGAG